MAPPLLLVSATAPEILPLREALGAEPVETAWGEAWRASEHGSELVLASLGVGKVNTAAGLALALIRWRPRAVVQVGVGGTYAGSFLSVGLAAAASVEVHIDSGAGEGDAWQDMSALGFPLLPGPPPHFNTMPTDDTLRRTLERVTGIEAQRFATSERVTGTLDEAERLRQRFDVAVESMEGAAAAQVCAALAVPFGEVRGISNVVGERDHRAWDIASAVRAANRAVEAALPDLLEAA